MFDDQIDVIADCIVSNLRTDECRAGCANCHLTELTKKLEMTYQKINQENGKQNDSFCNFISRSMIYKHFS